MNIVTLAMLELSIARFHFHFEPIGLVSVTGLMSLTVTLEALPSFLEHSHLQSLTTCRHNVCMYHVNKQTDRPFNSLELGWLRLSQNRPLNISVAAM